METEDKMENVTWICLGCYGDHVANCHRHITYIFSLFEVLVQRSIRRFVISIGIINVYIETTVGNIYCQYYLYKSFTDSLVNREISN